MRLIPALLVAASLLSAADAEPTAATPDAARQDMQVRIAQLEDQIRGLITEQANASGPAGAAASPDYAAAKARASADVRRRLDVIEYLLADNDYNRAIDTCNAVLADHPHEPATVRLKYRILTAMVEREKALIERERAYRAAEVQTEGTAKAVIPREPPEIKRTIWVFDEDVQAAERAAVQKRLKERITLNYDGVEVGEVLKPLFAVTGINYVILDSALSTEKLTLHLVNETVENTLGTIAKLVKVHYNYSGSTVFIGAEDSTVLVSEIIRLESGLTDVSTELQLPQPTGGGDGGGGAGGGGGTAPMIPQMPRAGQQGATSGQGGGSDLEKFLANVKDLVVGWPADGTIYLDRKSNTVYVRSTPAGISELKRMLHAMDYQSAQVLIEARFVEVLEGSERNLGIDWGGGGSNGRLTLGSAMSGGVQTPSGGLTFENVTSSIGAAQAGGTAGLNLGVLFSPSGMLGIKAAISALESDNKAESLAEPRILTLNNMYGQIALTQSISYIKGYDYSNSQPASTINNNGTTTTVGGVSNQNPQWAKDYEGITLKIRPSIARNSNVVTLEILPAVRVLLSRNTTQITSQASADAKPVVLNVENPDFRTRTLATTLHIKNGQTVVLGGLTQDDTTTDSSGVPGMRRVPFLGRLFNRDHTKVERSNLLIFVTAHIIDPSGAKIGEEIQRLKDTATVLLPEEARVAEAAERAAEDQRRAEAQAAEKKAADGAKSTPPPTKNWQRR